jgi:hypothetical protein
MYQDIHREVFRLKKTSRTRVEDTTRTAEVEEKTGETTEEILAGAALDDLMALKIRLALTDTIDYKLPPVIGD